MTKVSSGIISASQPVFSGSCKLHAAHFFTDGTVNASLVIYDGPNPSMLDTRKIYNIPVGGKEAGQDNIDLAMQKGLYVAITGTGAYCIIEYYR